MRKTLALCLALSMAAPSFAQNPAAFAWPVSPVQDQKEQGPCHIFAAVESVESFFGLLYGGTPSPGISQTHLYSICANANPFPSTTIPDALNFFQNTGVVDRSALPYATGTLCTVGDPGSTQYFALQINSNVTPNALHNNDCGTPYINCNPTAGIPSLRYRIGGYSVLNIGAFTTSDQLKHAIINDGPIALWMNVAALHPNPHAYCLYGWDAAGNWKLTDSWPGVGGPISTNVDIVAQFQANTDFKAYILSPTATHPAVYKQTYNSGTNTWSDDPTTTLSTTGCINAVSTAFTISGPTTVTSAGATYSVNNLGILDAPTVTWSMESVNGGSVGFSPTTGASTTATPGLTGAVNIVASIHRPNGICERIRLNNVAVQGNNIPFTLTKTQDLCSGTTRSIQYVASSSYPLTCAWTLHPPVGGGVFTITNGCTFTMDFTTTPSGYGITLALTSTALPGAHDGATAGGQANSCAMGHSIARDSLTAYGATFPSSATEISVFPNPTSGLLTVQLPSDKIYQIKLLNVMGTIVHTRQAVRSSALIDVSRLARGIYFVQIIDIATGTSTVKKVRIE